jgi:phospholipid-binding lipoprotein MlaA
MSVQPVRKALYFVVVTAFIVVFCGYTPAGAFNNEPVDNTLLLAQQTQESANEQSKTPGDEILDPANEAVEPLGLHLGLHLAQQTQKSTDEQSETPSDEVPDQAEQDKDDEYDDDEYDDDEYDDEDVELISDPLIQGNTDFYNFNDTMYFWVLKPVSRGYGFIIPEELRVAVRNVFYNIRFPVRFINCLLQGKGKKAQYEFGQFFLNTTVGFLGIANVASNYPHLQPSKEDLGQTFAVWGIGQGPYLMVPFLGPYSLRHGIGAVGDTFLDPIWWLFDELWVSLAIRAGETVNDTSMRIGEYEALKEAALDPYVMIRNAYVQNRNKLIAE